MSTSRLSACVLQTCLKSSKRVLRQPSRLFACGRWTTPAVSPRLASTSPRQYSTEALQEADVEGQPKIYTPKVQTLVDEISQLTLLEVADLNELLKKTLNIADTPMMSMGPMLAAAPAKEEAEEEEAETKQQKAFFTVKLMGFDSAKKVALIKQIKAKVPGMNLVQAKKFVESAPQNVQGDLTKDEAEELKKALEEAGGKLELE